MRLGEVLRATSRRAAARDFSWLSVGNQLTAVASLVSMAVLAHATSVPELGRVAFAQALAAVVLLVVDVRFEDAVQRFYPILLRDEGVNAAGEFFWRMCRWDVVLGLVIVVVALATHALGWIPTGDVWDPGYVAIALVTAGLGTVGGTLNSGYAVTSRLTDLGRRLSALAVLSGALSAVAAVTLGGTGYLLAHLLMAVITVGVCLVGLPIAWQRPGRGRPLPGGLPGFLVKSSASSSLALGTDAGVLAIAGLTGSSTFVAYAKVAQAPGRVVSSLFSPIAVQAYPLLSGYSAVGDHDASRRLTARVSRVIALAVLALLVPTVLLIEPLLGLVYGSDYQVAALAAFLFMAGSCCRAVVAWAKVLPLATGHPGLRLIIVGAESAVMVVAAAVCATASDEIRGLVALAGIYAATGGILASFWLWLSQGRVLYRGAEGTSALKRVDAS